MNVTGNTRINGFFVCPCKITNSQEILINNTAVEEGDVSVSSLSLGGQQGTKTSLFFVQFVGNAKNVPVEWNVENAQPLRYFWTVQHYHCDGTFSKREYSTY